MRPCFKFITAASAEAPAVLSIYDEIGFWGVQADDFRSSLNAITSKDLEVEISSPGGDYFAGLSMYHMLRQSGKTITTKVMGVAASAASIVFMAGDKRSMPDNTFLMVHNPSNGSGGNAKEHRKAADTLDKIAVGMRTVYSRNSSMSDDEIDTMLDTDTWISAAEALDMGLATEVTDGIKVAASFDMARADLPEAVRAVFKAAVVPPADEPEAPEDTPAADPVDEVDEVDEVETVADQIEARAKAVGMEAYASAFVLGATTLAEAETRISAAREIVALCKVAGRPDDASPAIKANKSIADVRASLIAARAAADEHTDTSKPSDKLDTKASSSGVVNPASVWNSHNAQSKKGRK